MMTDIRFSEQEKQLLATLVGQELKSYTCDEFLFTPTSFGQVELRAGATYLRVENVLETHDYFGSKEDVAALRVTTAAGPYVSQLAEHRAVTTNVHEVIQDVRIVEDTQAIFKDENLEGQFVFTKAVIFDLPNRQLVLEHVDWMSEDIAVYRGPGVEEKIGAVDEEREAFPDFEFRAERKIVSLKNCFS